jgi:hypothetical protein
METFRCHGCGTLFNAEKKTSHCRQCLDVVADQMRVRRAYLKEQGRCNGCGSVDVLGVGGTERCEICYFRDAAKKILGTRARWKELHHFGYNKRAYVRTLADNYDLASMHPLITFYRQVAFLNGSTTSQTSNGCIIALTR